MPTTFSANEFSPHGLSVNFMSFTVDIHHAK